MPSSHIFCCFQHILELLAGVEPRQEADDLASAHFLGGFNSFRSGLEPEGAEIAQLHDIALSELLGMITRKPSMAAVISMVLKVERSAAGTRSLSGICQAVLARRNGRPRGWMSGNKAAAQRKGYCFGAAGYPQLGQDITDMGFDRG